MFVSRPLYAVIFVLLACSAVMAHANTIELLAVSDTIDESPESKASVFLNGTKAGVTDINGRIILELEPNVKHSIRILSRTGDTGNNLEVLLDENMNRLEKVTLKSSGIDLPTIMSVSSVENGQLPGNFYDFVICFHSSFNQNEHYELVDLGQIELSEVSNEEERIDITDIFVIDKEGSAKAKYINKLRKIIDNMDGSITLSVWGAMAKSGRITNQISFKLALPQSQKAGHSKNLE